MRILICILIAYLCAACSTTHLMKNCVEVNDGTHWACQNLKPWE